MRKGGEGALADDPCFGEEGVGGEGAPADDPCFWGGGGGGLSRLHGVGAVMNF